MSDHDQRLKNLLRVFFPEFLQLFFPLWAARFDLSHLEWLDKEVFADPPQGERRFLDLIAKVETRQGVPSGRPGQEESWIALLHIEIEHADTVAPLRPRMFDYYCLLRRTYQLPVLPIGLYLQVGLDGIGQDFHEERFWELLVLRFEYLYVGLPALLAEEYVAGPNALGVALAAMMKLPEERKAWLRAEALRRIMGLPDNNVRRFLLGEFVQAYLPLDPVQQRQFDELLVNEPYRRVREMGTTWYEQGIEKGREQGQREFLLIQLEERFGPLSDQVRYRLQQLPADQVGTLVRALVRAQSLAELGLDNA